MSATPRGADGVPDYLRRLVDTSAQLPLRHRMPQATTTARRSAVLILFGEGATGPDVLLIEKSAHLRSHAGQVAFPGGGVDPGDDYPIGTALREAQEEAGIEPGGVRVLTTLQELYLPPSDRLVVPVVGWWDDPREVWVGDPHEVARVARVPLADLANPANRFRIRIPNGFVGPAFGVADMLVWGFTAGILEAVLEAAGLAVPWDEQDVRPLPPEALQPHMFPGRGGRELSIPVEEPDRGTGDPAHDSGAPTGGVPPVGSAVTRTVADR